MPRNNQKNSAKQGNSNSFELLSEVEDDTNKDGITSSAATRAGTSTRRRPLKSTQPYDPESPPRKKSVSTKPRATTGLNSNTDQLLRIKALLKRVEERAERAEKRVESLEEFRYLTLRTFQETPTNVPELGID
jgi:hypothetical protein